jgi:hypothetical protein
VIDPTQQNELASPYEWNRDVEVEVAVAVHDGGYAYRPGEVLVRGDEAADFVLKIAGDDLLQRSLERELLQRAGRDELPEGFVGAALVSGWKTIVGVGDVVGVVNAAKAAGVMVQPNHVFFAGSGRGCGCGGCPCPPHPSLAADLEGLLGHPLKANPLKANPLKANPLKANPLKANPLKANRVPVSSAFPTEKPIGAALNLPPAHAVPRVVIFDSGLAAGNQRPALFAGAAVRFADPDDPDTLPTPPDQFLDPVAGHGTFIAGIVEQLCPGMPLYLHKVVQPLGDADEEELFLALMFRLLVDFLNNDQATWPRTIFNLSLGGYLSDLGFLLESMCGLLRTLGIVVVASAGNLGECRPTYPAAFSTVVGVGALGQAGPADFTNYGPWVDACAPGADVVSAFFKDFDGKNVSVNGVDIDKFEGWAVWSGTSFAAPVVVAVLAREMRLRDINARQALEHVVEDPQRTRIPNLGTIVIG